MIADQSSTSSHELTNHFLDSLERREYGMLPTSPVIDFGRWVFHLSTSPRNALGAGRR